MMMLYVPSYATNYRAPVDGKIKGSAIYRKMSGCRRYIVQRSAANRFFFLKPKLPDAHTFEHIQDAEEEFLAHRHSHGTDMHAQTDSHDITSRQ